MAIRTVGAAGTYPFTKEGIDSAIAACSAGDTVRILDSGTITVSSYIYVWPAITIEGDPALYDGVNKATLPKLQASGSTRCFGLDANGINIRNLQFEGFLIESSGNAGGAINGQGYQFGTLENLFFTDCISCIQQGYGGTFRDIRATNVGRLMLSVTGPDVAVFEVVQRAGYDYIFDNGSDTTGTYALGAVYQDGSRTGHSVANLSGTGPTMRNISAYRAAGSGGTAFKGTYSYCTQTGYNALGSGTDGGNNYTRDPLFTDPAGGNFTFQSTSLELESGTPISGVTTDMIGQTLPLGSGWPRGSRDLATSTTVASITVLSSTSIKLVLAATKSGDATWEDAGNYAVTPSGGAAAVTVVSGAITDSGASITLTTSEHTQGGSYQVDWAGLTDVADGSDTYTGQGTSPDLSSVAVTTNQLIRLSFSEAMGAAGLSTPSNYTISPVTPGGPPITVSSATPGGGNTYVDLVISLGLAGKQYTVTADSSLVDSKGNTIGTRTANYTLQKATLLSMTRTIDTLVITLSAAADPASLTTLGSWTIARRAPLFGATPTVSAVALDSPTAPTVVTLTTTNHTELQNYRVSVSSTTGLDAGYLDYVGVGVEVSVTVSGFYFPNTTAVAVWDSDTEEWVSALSVSVVSDTQVTAVLPYYEPGTVTRIRVSAGTRHGYKAYTYP